MSEKAITREEQYLSAIAGDSTANIKPITRKEMFLAKAAGQSVPDIQPITREEFLLKRIADNGTSGGSGGGGKNVLVYENATIDKENLNVVMSNAFIKCSAGY